MTPLIASRIVARRSAARMVAQVLVRRHQHRRRAEAALQPVMVAERLLQLATACRRARPAPSTVSTRAAVGLHGEHAGTSGRSRRRAARCSCRRSRARRRGACPSGRGPRAGSRRASGAARPRASRQPPLTSIRTVDARRSCLMPALVRRVGGVRSARRRARARPAACSVPETSMSSGGSSPSRRRRPSSAVVVELVPTQSLETSTRYGVGDAQEHGSAAVQRRRVERRRPRRRRPGRSRGSARSPRGRRPPCARRRRREAHRGDQLAGLERGLVRAAEEVPRLDRARSPRAERTSIVASSATAAAGSSAHGAAYASEPPTVPRWRVAR